MNCLDFRRWIGAEPSAVAPELEVHGRECTACARYRLDLRAMDGLLARALAVDAALIRRSRAAASPAVARRRPQWLALAASIVVGLAVGLALWTGSPQPSLAREVIGHVAHEPDAMAATMPVPRTLLDGVLDPEGTRLRPGLGDVTYAERCVFEGRVVPHLVVRMPEGPVTVLLLRHRNVSESVRLAEQGYAGVVLPAPRGSIAIVSQDGKVPDGVARQVFDAVDWGV